MILVAISVITVAVFGYSFDLCGYVCDILAIFSIIVAICVIIVAILVNIMAILPSFWLCLCHCDCFCNLFGYFCDQSHFIRPEYSHGPHLSVTESVSHIVVKTRGRCPCYFQACCAIFLPVYTQVLFFWHFAVT